MTQWSDFCRKYALENGISYTAASKLPIVKDLYKLQKAETLETNDMIFQEKLEAAIIAFEEETLEVMEPDVPLAALEQLVIAGELPEDETVKVTIDLPVTPQTGSVFVSKTKKPKVIGNKRT